MKNLCGMFIFMLVLGIAPSRTAAQATKSALTNQDVVELLKTGLSYDVVVAKINSSPTNFDTSTAALKDLKAAGVSDAVILAMVQAAGKPAEQAPAAAPADSGKSDASSSESAHVRVYRPHQVPGGGFYPPISIDDKPIAKLSNGRRFSVRISPGPHVITSDDKTSAISIDAKPGQEFYISVQELPGGFLKGRGKMTLVAVEQGRPEYKLNKPIEDERKIEKEMIEPDSE